MLELLVTIAAIWTACSLALLMFLSAIIRRTRSPKPPRLTLVVRSVRPPL